MRWGLVRDCALSDSRSEWPRPGATPWRRVRASMRARARVRAQSAHRRGAGVASRWLQRGAMRLSSSLYDGHVLAQQCEMGRQRLWAGAAAGMPPQPRPWIVAVLDRDRDRADCGRTRVFAAQARASALSFCSARARADAQAPARPPARPPVLRVWRCPRRAAWPCDWTGPGWAGESLACLGEFGTVMQPWSSGAAPSERTEWWTHSGRKGNLGPPRRLHAMRWGRREAAR